MNKKSNVKGLNREVYALLSSDNKDAVSLMPSDFPLSSKFGYPPFGYKVTKANLSLKTATKWKWTQFTNPARSDGFLLSHWRPVSLESKEYPFAKFNKSMIVPEYTDEEYERHLQSPNWTKEETDYLMGLCKKYDTRFIVIHDRWDNSLYKERTIEEIKDRYYTIINKFDLGMPQKYPFKFSKFPCVFDAEHERIRKDQLMKLYNRTPEEVKEEDYLIEQMRKIELRKKERDKKALELKKLILRADSTNEIFRKNDSNQSRGSGVFARQSRKKLSQLRGTRMSDIGLIGYIDLGGIKFPEPKTTGIWARSSLIKMPTTIGQKRIKAIDEMLRKLNIIGIPVMTEDICREFNELRNKMYMLYELKIALTNAEFENQLKHQDEQIYDPNAPSTPLSAISLPDNLTTTFGSLNGSFSSTRNCDVKKISEVFESSPVTVRKRRAAIEQENMMKKLNKKRTLS